MVAAPAGLLAATTLALGLADGGYFAGATAAATVFLGMVLVLVVASGATLAPRAAGRLVMAAFGALATWVLLSSSWSGTSARTLIEFDRVLLYGFGFALGALSLGTPRATRWALRLLWTALLALSAVGLLSRLAPALLEAPASLVPQRLSHPLGYWNAVGLLAGLGGLLAVGLAADRREPIPIRAAAAGSLPALALTLYLTFSRGAILATSVGIVTLLLLGRPRGTLLALAAGIPTVGLTLLVASLSPDLIGSPALDPTPGGFRVGALSALVASSFGAALVVTRGLPLEPSLPRWHPGRKLRAWSRRLLLLSPILLLAVVLAIVQDGSGGPSSQAVQPTPSERPGEPRDRLTSIDSNGRLELWRVALGSFGAEPLHGTGAGTFARTWVRERRDPFRAQDGHSLVLETLSELGVVGGVLIALIIGVGLRAALAGRSRDRETSSLIFAIALAWTLHASIDWDWEMPVVTLPVFALLGAASGAIGPARPRATRGDRSRRVLAIVVVLLLLVTPVRVGLSQQRLVEAIGAFNRGDCPRAIRAALGSLDILSQRSEALEILAYCDARSGRSALAASVIAEARRLEPDDWTLRYATGVILATGGRDPRPQLRVARTFNPADPVVSRLLRRFESEDPRVWRREAAAAPLDVPLSGGVRTP